MLCCYLSLALLPPSARQQPVRDGTKQKGAAGTNHSHQDGGMVSHRSCTFGGAKTDAPGSTKRRAALGDGGWAQSHAVYYFDPGRPSPAVSPPPPPHTRPPPLRGSFQQALWDGTSKRPLRWGWGVVSRETLEFTFMQPLRDLLTPPSKSQQQIVQGKMTAYGYLH